MKPCFPTHGGQTLLFTASVLFLLVLLLSLLGWYRGRLMSAIDYTLMGIQGVAGIVIALMYFFSEHPTLDTNWLVICLNPLPASLNASTGRRAAPAFSIDPAPACSAHLSHLMQRFKRLNAQNT